MNLPDTERAYIAGLIDGEGSISVAHSRTCLQLFVTVSMTDAIGPKLLKEYYGGSLVQGDRLKIGYKPYWVWKVTGLGCFQVLKDIEPFIRVKRKQMQLALRFLTMVKTIGDGRKYTNDENKIRKRIARQLRRLNKRGHSENLGR